MISSEHTVLTRLNSLATVRSQAKRLLELARQDTLRHFSLDEAKLLPTAHFVGEVIRQNYPSLDIPYHSRWRHFEAGAYDRLQYLRSRMSGLSSQEMGRIYYELVIVSVLLDAGAGTDWSFYDNLSEQHLTRSEGLAAAVFSMYLGGAFSNDPQQPLRVDSERLRTFSLEELKKGFQVHENNPLEGLKGRLQLLNTLGELLQKQPQYFDPEARLGNFYSAIEKKCQNGVIQASEIFATVLDALQELWPQRLQYEGIPLGDVWIHPLLKTEEEGSEYIPFHKLSQWLTYSLLEPLEWTGLTVDKIDRLTGLPEYRNGGLFIDLGVLIPRSENLLKEAQLPSSEAIVEWRGLTLALLDGLAERIRDILGMDEKALALAKILQGGTWDAGRKIAREIRKDGAPPITIISDGTVF